MTGEEARHRTVAAEVNLCNECLAEAAIADARRIVAWLLPLTDPVAQSRP